MKWLSLACFIQQLVGRRRSLLLADDVLFAVIGVLPCIRNDGLMMLFLEAETVSDASIPLRAERAAAEH